MADQRDIDRLLQDLEQQPGLPKGAVRDLREAIDTSPYLASVMTQAIDLGALRRLEVSNHPNEGGHYDDKTGTVSINTSIFAPSIRSDRLDMLAGTLGHETGHALMAPSAQVSLNTFVFKLDAALKDGIQYGESVVDATALSKEYVASARQNEALAELVSMNAVASRVETTTGEFNQAEFLRRVEPTTACVRGGKLEPGIHLDEHGLQRTGNSISSPAVEAVAVCHFDRSDSSMGTQGTSNYAGYYASYAVSAGAVLLKERAGSTTQALPRLGYNLAELSTDTAKLEGAGLNLGGQGKAFGFVDTSHGQQREVEVRQLGPAQHRPDIEPPLAAVPFAGVGRQSRPPGPLDLSADPLLGARHRQLERRREPERHSSPLQAADRGPVAEAGGSSHGRARPRWGPQRLRGLRAAWGGSCAHVSCPCRWARGLTAAGPAEPSAGRGHQARPSAAATDGTDSATNSSAGARATDDDERSMTVSLVFLFRRVARN